MVELRRTAAAGRRRQERAANTRASILAAAEELFATRGFRATGIRDIAAAADVNPALIAYHFGGKGDLYDEILAEAAAAAEEIARTSDLLDDAYPERRLVRVFAEALTARPALPPMVMREHLDPERLLEPRTAGTLSRFMELTEAVLERLPLDDEARAWDPQIVHLAVVGPLVHFLVSAKMRESVAARLARPISTPSLDEFVETLAAMLSRALRGRIRSEN